MPTRSLVSRAWWSTVAIFLIHGLTVATWVSRIPAVQSKLRLNNGTLGLALLGTAAGSVLAIPFTGWLVTRYGSRRITGWAAFGFCLSLVPLSLAVNAETLAAALFLFGALAGMMDVAMNAQGVEVEKALGNPTMSRFHAMFSLGGMVGAGVGGFIAARGVAPWLHFAGAALLLFVFALIVAPGMLNPITEGLEPPAHHVPFRNMPKVLLALSAIAFCMLLSEGAMADWTAVYLKQVLSAGPGTAAAGYAVFSAAMAIFRLFGDLITARLGSVWTVRTGSLVAAAGLAGALAATSARWALPGFAVTGAGFSVVVPLVFGAGGRVKNVSPGAGIATVTGLGYIGFLVGPPSIGFTSQLLTLRYALGIVVLLCLVSAILSGSVRSRAREEVAA